MEINVNNETFLRVLETIVAVLCRGAVIFTKNKLYFIKLMENSQFIINQNSVFVFVQRIQNGTPVFCQVCELKFWRARKTQ